MLRRRLIVGAGLIGLFALVIGLARLVYGPGDSVAPEQLSAVVLQSEDVPGARQAANCSGDAKEEPVRTDEPIKAAIQVAFLLGNDSEQADTLCVQSVAGITESRARAATAMREFDRSFLEQIRILEDSTERKLGVEQLDIPRLGERSVAYVWGCTQECEDGEGGAYILQFQRGNVISVIVLTGEFQGSPVDQLLGLGRTQDARIVAALNAND